MEGNVVSPIDRPTYWTYAGAYLGATFMVAFMDGYTGAVPGSAYGQITLLLQLFSIPFFWFIGYWRLKDAGKHGGWAILAPFLLATIVIGCFKTDELFE
jgi:uncharacterized membrane protein YhaH (DUF805 family)